MLMKTKPPQRPTLIWFKQTSASVIVGGEVEAVDHLFVGAVELEAPGVEATADLPGGEVAHAGGQPGALVRAGVVEGPDGVGVAPGDQDRLVANDVLEVVADIAHLFFAARHLPDPGPQPLHLEVEELLGDVALLRNDVGLRGGDQVPLAAERHHHRASPSPSGPHGLSGLLSIFGHRLWPDDPCGPCGLVYSDSRIPECYSRLRCPEGMWGERARLHRLGSQHHPHRPAPSRPRPPGRSAARQGVSRAGATGADRRRLPGLAVDRRHGSGRQEGRARPLPRRA